MEQWTIDATFLGHVSPHQGLVVLLDPLSHEHFPQRTSYFRGPGHEHQTGRRPIQPMDRVKELLQLVSESLEQYRLGIQGVRSTMNHHPSGFVDSYQIFIAVNDLDRLA
jgi:hypothetical protein